MEVAVALGAEVEGGGAPEEAAVVRAEPVPFLQSLLLRHLLKARSIDGSLVEI